MIRISIALLAVASVAACGGSRYSSENAQSNRVAFPRPATGSIIGAAPAPLPFARGPIFKACQADNRKAASRARCGCVQAVADQSLSASDQKRGTRYFTDPGKLQEVRQSDNPGNERFWLAWKAFGQAAAKQCRNS